MGVLTGATTVKTSEEEVVWSEDPAVEVPAHLRGCGWVPLSECRDRPGADVLRIRSLTPAERTRSRDLWARSGEASMNAYIASAAVIQHNRQKNARVRAFVEVLEQREVVMLDLLAARILCLTRGVDPAETYERARSTLRVEPAAEEESTAEEGATDADSKSDGG